MKPPQRWSLAVAIIVLVALGLTRGDDQRELTKTSYGTVAAGTGALYALLAQLNLTAGRSFSSVAGLPPDATVWWIAPDGLCRGFIEGEPFDARSGIWGSIDWATRGGTAVILLPEARLPCLETIEISGVPAPMRPRDVDTQRPKVTDPLPEPGAEDGRGFSTPDEPGDITVAGTLHPAPRSLGTMPMQFFSTSAGFEALSIDGSGRALVVSRATGSGRVVFVATSIPLTNRWLDHRDGALFAVDLVVALGTPFIDERGHGMQPVQNVIPYLLTSSALPAFAGAALLALLALWWGHAPLPPGTAGSDLPPPPSLENFVSSIASLYATTQDNRNVLLAYQEFALNQLRRSFRLSADVPAQQVIDRIVATRHLTGDDLRLLQDPPTYPRRAELVKAVARIDALVAEVVR